MIHLVLAAAAVATAAPATTPVAKSDDPLICHDEVIAGSRVPSRVCMRRSSIQAQARDGRAMTEKLQAGVVTRPSSN